MVQLRILSEAPASSALQLGSEAWETGKRLSIIEGYRKSIEVAPE